MQLATNEGRKSQFNSWNKKRLLISPPQLQIKHKEANSRNLHQQPSLQTKEMQGYSLQFQT